MGIVTSMDGLIVSFNTPTRSFRLHKNQIKLYGYWPEVPNEQTEPIKEDPLPNEAKGEDPSIVALSCSVCMKQKPG